MEEKKVDILLSLADALKLCVIGFGSVFFLEATKTVETVNKTVLFGSLLVLAVSLISLVYVWFKAYNMTNRG
jgi:hypothetical protein